MNRQWDLIIIGGGIVGSSAAYYAARQGLSILIVERDAIGAAQSGRSLGLVRRLGRDEEEIPLMIEAMGIWRSIEKELGRSVAWKAGGNLCCASDEKTLQSYRQWWERTKSFGFGTRLLTPGEISDVLPGMAQRFIGALYIEDDGMADPVKATRAFYDAAIDLGAQVALGSAVDEIVTLAGSVQGVRIGNQLLKSDRVLCAAGAASSKLLRKQGLLFPQDSVRASIMRTEPVRRTIAPAVIGGNIGFRQGKDNSLYVYHTDATYDVRLDSPRFGRWFKDLLLSDANSVKINPLSKIARKLSQAKSSPVNEIPASWQAPYADHQALGKAHVELGELFPEFNAVPIMSQWAGYIDYTPDGLPVIGKVETAAGLVVASGFSGHGFGLGPSVGKRVVELLINGQVDIPKAFYPYRFASGAWRDLASTAAL